LWRRKGEGGKKTDVKLETIDKLVAAVHKKIVMHFFHLIFSKLSFAQRKIASDVVMQHQLL